MLYRIPNDEEKNPLPITDDWIFATRHQLKGWLNMMNESADKYVLLITIIWLFTENETCVKNNHKTPSLSIKLSD